MKKMSRIESILVPALRTAMKPRMDSSEPIIAKDQVSLFLTHFLDANYPSPKGLSKNVVQVKTLTKAQQDLIEKEYSNDCSTLSFDILFKNCLGKACYELKGDFERDTWLEDTNPRPSITFVNGKAPAYIAFVTEDYKEVVMVLNVYNKNLKQWAEKIDLRKTKYRSSTPTSHYIFREKAIESGFLWFNKELLGVKVDKQ